MGVMDESLWGALSAMRIEPEGATLTFTRRLARENRWSQAHAARVVEEYKRFLYLAAVGTTTATPSDQVDQAWHLHLAYTRHYWGDLCAHIIGRPLHHGPTAGGSAEGRKFRSLYAETLQRYRDTFGAEPPADIWPPTDARFAGTFQRVDRSRYFLLPRRSVSIAGITGGAVLLAACTAMAADTTGAAGSPILRRIADFLFGTNAGLIAFVIGGTMLLFAIAMLIDHLRRRPINRASDHAAPRKRQLRDSSSTGDTGSDGWISGGSGTAAAGGAAFIGAGGDFGGSGADGGWESSGDSGSGDSGCGGCGGD